VEAVAWSEGEELDDRGRLAPFPVGRRDVAAVDLDLKSSEQ
jgi:hypothetical protein